MRLYSNFALVLLLLANFAHAGYRPLEAPAEWTFMAVSPAFNPKTGEKMGDFQPGIEVEVLEERFEEDQWLVTFRRYGAADVEALIPIPSLIDGNIRLQEVSESMLVNFPILKEQLASSKPWPEEAKALAKRHFSESFIEDGTKKNPKRLVATDSITDGVAWGISPLKVAVDYRLEDNPKIVFELWNKGDSHRSRIRPDKANTILQDTLNELEGLYGTHRGAAARRSSSSGITAVKDNAELYFLPNDTLATLRYNSGEYLILELSSFRASAQEATIEEYDPESFAETIRSRVKESKRGHKYVSGVPMISQGDKGYCAAATLARVLNYYGYPVDMHSMADLAETSANGTSKENIVRSMRRVCSSTPFRMEKLDTRRRSEILEVIESGTPIIWLVPGHMRLLLGVEPEEGSVVYSDSWGPGHDFKTMGWGDFVNLNEGMYVLKPAK